MWHQFLLVAGAHFLALLSPGPDFFLILRYAMARGRGHAALVSLGITLANALFIVLALGGLTALETRGAWFAVIQWLGALFLLYMGVQFIRHAGKTSLKPDFQAGIPPAARSRALFAGLASGLLNPKNALFYASLFSLLQTKATPIGTQTLYALWMVAIVLAWDLLVGHLAGHSWLRQRFGHWLTTIERMAGAVLILLGGILVITSA